MPLTIIPGLIPGFTSCSRKCFHFAADFSFSRSVILIKQSACQKGSYFKKIFKFFFFFFPMFRHPFSPYISSYSRNFPHIYRHIQEIPPYIPSYSRKKIGKHYFEKDFCLPVRPLSTSLPLQRKAAEDPFLTIWKKLRHFFILYSKNSVIISTFSPALLAVQKFPLYTINFLSK